MTYCLVVIGWILFRAETIQDAWRYICRICSYSLFTKPFGYGRSHDMWVAVIWIAVMFAVEWLQRRRDHGLVIDSIRSPWLRWAIYYGVLVAIFFSRGVETFIYFQF